MLERAGYLVTKAGGSLGIFDLVAVGPEDVLLVQVKSNRAPGPAERDAMSAVRRPFNCRAQHHVWLDHARQPIVTEV